MILLFTDFGSEGPYLSQMIASIRGEGYTGEVLSMFADAPVFNPQFSAMLLSHYFEDFPKGSTFLTVVDPGVGSARKAIAVNSCGCWFVGPDNGLFDYILRKDSNARVYEINWRPEQLSSSFHGRDLFAPVAAKLGISDEPLPGLMEAISLENIVRPNWPESTNQIIYIDHYGNCMTGLVANSKMTALEVAGTYLPIMKTFSDRPVGSPLAYLNANGLIEIAVNQARADAYFNLSVGSEVTVITN